VRVRGDDEQSGHAMRRLPPRFETLYTTTGRPSIPPPFTLAVDACLVAALACCRRNMECELIDWRLVALATDPAGREYTADMDLTPKR
jgi:hypothetical protein